MTKRILTLAMSFMMVLSLAMTGYASDVSYESKVQSMVEQKMSIVIPQLEAQNAEHMIPVYQEIILAMVESSLNGTAEYDGDGDNVNDVFAPRGGSVAYKLPREWGVAPSPVLAVGCTNKQAEYWTGKVTNQTTVMELLDKGLEIGADFLPPYVADLGGAMLGVALKLNQSILDDIENCNGKVLVVTTYSNIDNAAYPAVMGWDSTMIPVPHNALEVVSKVL